MRVDPRAPAAQAGLRRGDIIVAVERHDDRGRAAFHPAGLRCADREHGEPVDHPRGAPRDRSRADLAGAVAARRGAAESPPGDRQRCRRRSIAIRGRRPTVMPMRGLQASIALRQTGILDAQLRRHEVAQVLAQRNAERPRQVAGPAAERCGFETSPAGFPVPRARRRRISVFTLEGFQRADQTPRRASLPAR